MKGYEQYIEDVKSGKIVTGELIKLAVKRFETFKNREDIYFDEEEVDRCIRFIGRMKHFLGKSAGKPFILTDWQQFLIANVFGLKWKESNFRVCREILLMCSRKCGKDALAAAIAIYLLIADGEASPQIILAANTTDQGKIAFDFIDNFAKSLDPSEKVLQHYRNYIKMPKNNGIVQVVSSDASKMDGKNVSTYILDEFEEAKDRKMFDVLASSQGMREQPLGIILQTAGFNLDGAAHDLYNTSMELLYGIKEMDNFFPFIFQMDENDDWTDDKNWIKCQPNLGVTVTKAFMRQEMNRALTDTTSLVGVKTKIFNQWCSSFQTWIPQEIIARQMRPIELEEFKGKNVIMGCDLSTVSDFSSISIMLPPEDGCDKYVFKSWTFLPNDTIANHPYRKLYEKFIEEGSMIVTPGNVIDNDYIIAKIGEIARVCYITHIYLDKWNAVSMQVALTEAGYDVNEFSQSIGNYNGCTKEFETLARSGQLIIDKSANILWQMSNVVLKQDFNGNVKPSKESNKNKIDSIISMTTALGGYLKDPICNDYEIFSLT